MTSSSLPESEHTEAVLFIDRFDSHCGVCGRGADPKEKAHVTGLGWGTQEPGCGAVWTHVSTDCAGMNPSGMRPDLIWVDPMEAIRDA